MRKWGWALAVAVLVMFGLERQARAEDILVYGFVGQGSSTPEERDLQGRVERAVARGLTSHEPGRAAFTRTLPHDDKNKTFVVTMLRSLQGTVPEDLSTDIFKVQGIPAGTKFRSFLEVVTFREDQRINVELTLYTLPVKRGEALQVTAQKHVGADSTALDDLANQLTEAARLISSTKADSDANLPVPVLAPLAPAYVAGRPITLDGSASHDPDHDAIEITWLQANGAGAAGELVVPGGKKSGPRLTFTPTKAGELKLTMVVTQHVSRRSSPKAFTIKVVEPSRTSAGADTMVEELGTCQALDDTGSAKMTRFAWHQVAGPRARFCDPHSNADFAGPACTALVTGMCGFRPTVPGEYRYRLEARHDSVEGTATVAFLVSPPPRALAGSSMQTKPKHLLVFNPNGSSDPLGKPLRYRWRLQSADPQRERAVLLNSATAQPTFVADDFGHYKVELEVEADRSFANEQLTAHEKSVVDIEVSAAEWTFLLAPYEEGYAGVNKTTPPLVASLTVGAYWRPVGVQWFGLRFLQTLVQMSQREGVDVGDRFLGGGTTNLSASLSFRPLLRSLFNPDAISWAGTDVGIHGGYVTLLSAGGDDGADVGAYLFRRISGRTLVTFDTGGRFYNLNNSYQSFYVGVGLGYEL